ncbi:MAG: alpha-amylase family glycosyl hydrolase [Thermomicrobiales bacterium]
MRLSNPEMGREAKVAAQRLDRNSREVVYGVVPRNFDPPGFAGVMARLDSLADLGVTSLWLTPITPTLPGAFGYEVLDYTDIRSDYGSKDEFRALVDGAHARGMRVLLDVVPNHTSDQHPFALEAERNGPGSPYWDYYDRDETGAPTHYFSWHHLPNLNVDNPAVQQFIQDAFAYWMREFGVDGFRIDAIWGIRQRNPQFLAALVQALRAINPDVLLIAEAGARDPYYAEHDFDAAYDWNEELGQWAWRDVFSGERPPGEVLTEAITNAGQGYRADNLVLRFLNNNDTGPRFITTYGVGCYRAAMAMLLTLPGIPCLFTGDEVGAEYEPYKTPGVIDWSDRHGLRDDVRRLIALRKQVPALHSRGWKPLEVSPADSLFAYLRGDRKSGQAVVVINFLPDEQRVALDLPARCTSDGQMRDQWSGETYGIPEVGPLELVLPGHGFRIMIAGQ